MLDIFILKIEQKRHYVLLIFISFLISIILSYVNSFIGGNSLFAVSLISLALAYPVTTYLREMDRLEIDEYSKHTSFLKRYSKELLIFWSIFMGVFLGLFVSISFTNDFSYQESFVSEIAGNFIHIENSFFDILYNNLNVAFFTMIISFFVFSGLIFVLVWNASILAYYVSTFESFDKIFLISFFLLPHALLEIGGYVFAGLAGAILAYRLDLAYMTKFYNLFTKKGERQTFRDKRNTFRKIINKRLFVDLACLVGFSVFLVCLGAVIESL